MIMRFTGKDVIRPHAWFVGYAPSDHPRIAVAVLIEHGGAGSSTAGPIAREMMLSWLFPEIETENTSGGRRRCRYCRSYRCRLRV
jgi:penicillin-binding protein 2